MLQIEKIICPDYLFFLFFSSISVEFSVLKLVGSARISSFFQLGPPNKLAQTHETVTNRSWL